MSLAIKDVIPGDFATRAERLRRTYREAQAAAEASLPWKQKVKRTVGRLYRSRGERLVASGYYKAEFAIDSSPKPLAKVG